MGNQRPDPGTLSSPSHSCGFGLYGRPFEIWLQGREAGGGGGDNTRELLIGLMVTQLPNWKREYIHSRGAHGLKLVV